MFYEKKAAEKLVTFEQAEKNLREDAEISRVLDEAILNKDADRVAEILFHSAWYTQAGSMTRGFPRGRPLQLRWPFVITIVWAAR